MPDAGNVHLREPAGLGWTFPAGGAGNVHRWRLARPIRTFPGTVSASSRRALPAERVTAHRGGSEPRDDSFADEPDLVGQVGEVGKLDARPLAWLAAIGKGEDNVVDTRWQDVRLDLGGDLLRGTGDAETIRPAARLMAWLRRFSAYFISKRLVAAELLQHSDPHDPVFGAGYTRVHDAGRPLLAAAQEAREVRDDLSLEQILDLVAAIARIPGDTSYREPILQAALDSLRPPTDP